jgi:hypothetical protein
MTRNKETADEPASPRRAVVGTLPDRPVPGGCPCAGAIPGGGAPFLEGVGGGPGVRNQRDLVGRAAALRPARRPPGDGLALAGEHLAGRCGPGARGAGDDLWDRARGVRAERPGGGGLPPGGGPEGEPRQRRAPDHRHEHLLHRGRAGLRDGAGGHLGPGRAPGHGGPCWPGDSAPHPPRSTPPRPAGHPPRAATIGGHSGSSAGPPSRARSSSTASIRSWPSTS